MTNDMLLLNALLPATPDRLFRALTDPADLVLWFSQQSEFDPAVTGTGRFEGKDGHFLESWTVEAMIPSQRLVVVWSSQADWFADVRLRVTFVLSSEGGATRLRVSSESLGVQTARVQDALLEWSSALAQLQTLLEAEEEQVLAAQSCTLHVDLAAAPERVWQALTDPQELRQWFWDDVEFAPQAGAPFRLRGAGQSRADTGYVVRVRPGDSLVLDWHDGNSWRRVYWRLRGGTWTIQDGPFAGSDAWRQPLCEVGWRNVQSALQAYLSADKGVFDRSAIDTTCEVELPSTVEGAWTALTDPSLLTQWLADECDPLLALAWPQSQPDRQASVLHADPSGRLTLLWSNGPVHTVVSLTLTSREATTWMRIHHWGFLGHDELRQQQSAFWSDATEALKRLLAPPPQPDTEAPAAPQPTATLPEPPAF